MEHAENGPRATMKRVNIHTFHCVTTCTERSTMATDPTINDNPTKETRRPGGRTTKKDAVAAALDKNTRRSKQVDIVKLFGTVEYARGYDHKANRRRGACACASE